MSASAWPQHWRRLGVLQPAAYPATEGRGTAGAATGARGTVILPFGRYFAGRADMLTRDGFKTIVPIDGISPFSGVGDPDPEMQRFADSERVNERVETDVRKDLAARLADADAEFLVVDNSSALLLHREVNGRLYTLLPGEDDRPHGHAVERRSGPGARARRSSSPTADSPTA